jgi:hypothetical protein
MGRSIYPNQYGNDQRIPMKRTKYPQELGIEFVLRVEKHAKYYELLQFLTTML